MTLLASASLSDVSPCCVGGSDVMDSRMATSGGDTATHKKRGGTIMGQTDGRERACVCV